MPILEADRGSNIEPLASNRVLGTTRLVAQEFQLFVLASTGPLVGKLIWTFGRCWKTDLSFFDFNVVVVGSDI